MYTVIGWVVLVYSPGDDDSPASNRLALDALIAGFRADWGPAATIEVRDHTLDRVLFLHTSNNRSVDRPEELGMFLQELGRLYPGSYGLVHEHVDDREEARWNEYRVRVMVRGVMTDHHDPYFSPIQPTIEDGVGPRSGSGT